MRIFKYRNEHLDKVKSIFNENVPTYFAADEWEDFLLYIKDHWKTYYIVELDHQIVGAGGYHLVDNITARLSWDFVRPGFHGMGIGRTLVSECLEKIEAQLSIRNIEVWTSQHADQFYSKFGFQTSYKEIDYWGKGLHLYKMVKCINADQHELE